MFYFIILFQQYQDLLEKEKRKRSPETSESERDSECYDTIHNGRDVIVCECTTDKCNSATSTVISRQNVVAAVATLAAVWIAASSSSILV